MRSTRSSSASRMAGFTFGHRFAEAALVARDAPRHYVENKFFVTGNKTLRPLFIQLTWPDSFAME